MKQPLLSTLKNRWFAFLVHLAIWILLCLAVIGLTGKMPEVHEEESFSAPPQDAVPVSKLGQLFVPDNNPKPPGPATNVSAFYTRHFVPVAPAAPPAPTTLKFELTYQGFYQADDIRKTVIKIATNYVVTGVGGRVISNWFVADAAFQALVLTNQAAQTNIFLLNTKKEIEVPIQ